MVFVCDAASSKSQVTAVLVSKLLNEPIKDDIKRELKIFSQQILHRKIRFTACGFFVLDFTLLHTIIALFIDLPIRIRLNLQGDPTMCFLTTMYLGSEAPLIAQSRGNQELSLRAVVSTNLHSHAPRHSLITQTWLPPPQQQSWNRLPGVAHRGPRGVALTSYPRYTMNVEDPRSSHTDDLIGVLAIPDSSVLYIDQGLPRGGVTTGFLENCQYRKVVSRPTYIRPDPYDRAP
uniref:Uncharacterized protein n=1 Tax=Timema cristinae TaxID=61476 RepID=A0A7R9H894_TIMCR|nr:unnamed protein product [Timema cristinae]